MTAVLDRRAVLTALGLLLGGCAAPGAYGPQRIAIGGYYPGYGPIEDHGHRIPGLDPSIVSPDKLRQEVAFAGPYRPGTIVVDVADRRLYLVEPGRRALRYTVGVGRQEALNFRGAAVIGRKAEWPHWAPTETMIERMPRYAAYASGMPGGIGNPLGARALYLYRGNKDTYFRLHGTNEPETIGSKVSSGCIRLFNHDIIDLYNRVPVGAPVVVLQESGAVADSGERGPTAVAAETNVGYRRGDMGPDFDDAGPPTGPWPAPGPWREYGPPEDEAWF